MANVGPLAQGGLNEAFGLAVGARGVGTGEAVLDAELEAGGAKVAGAIAGGWPTLNHIPTPEGGSFKLRLSGDFLRRAYLHRRKNYSCGSGLKIKSPASQAGLEQLPVGSYLSSKAIITH
jgi:hypothetical protein